MCHSFLSVLREITDPLWTLWKVLEQGHGPTKIPAVLCHPHVAEGSAQVAQSGQEWAGGLRAIGGRAGTGPRSSQCVCSMPCGCMYVTAAAQKGPASASRTEAAWLHSATRTFRTYGTSTTSPQALLPFQSACPAPGLVQKQEVVGDGEGNRHVWAGGGGERSPCGGRRDRDRDRERTAPPRLLSHGDGGTGLEGGQHKAEAGGRMSGAELRESRCVRGRALGLRS